MTKAEHFHLCLIAAQRIVARYRAEAPAGCDPQNTWVALGVGVAGVAVSAGTSAYNSSQQKKAAAKAQSSNSSAMGKSLPNMPKYVPANFWGINQGAQIADQTAYQMSDADFKSRHPEIVQAEQDFATHTAADQKGDSTFIPQMQAEAVNAGLGSALDAFGDTGPVLARGGAGEAQVAKNLGLSIMGFQDRNRQNAQQSLSLAEQIFPRRQIGMTGADFAQVALGNVNGQNSYNQANYAAKVGQQINSTNASVASNNAAAAAQGQASAAQAQMYAGMANSALSTAGTAYGNYTSKAATGASPAAPKVATTTSITAR